MTRRVLVSGSPPSPPRSMYIYIYIERERERLQDRGMRGKSASIARFVGRTVVRNLVLHQVCVGLLPEYLEEYKAARQRVREGSARAQSESGVRERSQRRQSESAVREGSRAVREGAAT